MDPPARQRELFGLPQRPGFLTLPCARRCEEVQDKLSLIIACTSNRAQSR